MRKASLLTIFSAIAFYANAQIQKGTIVTGVHANYFTSNFEIIRGPVDGNTYKILQLHPSAGIAVRKNLVVGAGINYGRGSAGNQSDARTYRGTGVGGFVFVRKYIPLNQRFMAFADASLYYDHSKNTSQNTTGSPDKYTARYWETGIGFYPGVTYSITKNIQLEAGVANIFNVSYNGRKNGADPTDKRFSTRTNLSMTNPFTIGIKIILPKK